MAIINNVIEGIRGKNTQEMLESLELIRLLRLTRDNGTQSRYIELSGLRMPWNFSLLKVLELKMCRRCQSY